MTPLFSIITITFNASKELPPTMQSVASQTFQNFEHLIIDGKSTDNTIDVAKNLGTENIRIFSEKDNGLYDAMNKGIKVAQGKYLIFLNAGDSFHENSTLQSYAESAEKNPDIIYGDTIVVNSERKIIAPRHLSAPETLTFESFKRGMSVCHQAFVVKREIAPTYNLNYRFSADYEWCLRCIKMSTPDNCINLNKVVIDYLSDGLTDKNRKASLLERYAIMCKYYGKLSTILHHISFIPRHILYIVKNSLFFLK